MVSTNCRTRGYFRLQGFRTRPLAWPCATNWPTILLGVIEKFPRGEHRAGDGLRPAHRAVAAGSLGLIRGCPGAMNSIASEMGRDVMLSLRSKARDPKRQRRSSRQRDVQAPY